MSVSGQLLGNAVGHLPPSVIRRLAKQYSAGATVEDAMDEVRALASSGMASTVAMLGEAASSASYADSQMRELRSVLDEATRAPELDIRLGIKPSALGLDVDHALFRQNLDQLATEAERASCVLEVDMEQLPYVTPTLAAVQEARLAHHNVWAVVQAYLRRSIDDVHGLVAASVPARIVKGTYKPGPADAYQLRDVVRENFLALVRAYFEAGVPVAIATHDEYLIYRALRIADETGVPKDHYEFQMIMGVGEALRGPLLDRGYKVRVTVHFGSDLHKWSVRRLKENPEIARYAIRGMRDGMRGRREETQSVR